MTTQLKRASVMAIVEETTVGELKAPSAGSDAIPLRAGFSMEGGVEELTSDELLNDIGESEPALGKETPSGTHPAYFKHSEVEGQAPEYGLFLKSALGAEAIAAAEYNTVSGSTTKVVNVDTGEGATFEVGEALLIKDATNGYSIRNIESISTDALTLNYALDTAPGTGVDLGQAVLYKPTSTNIPSFSAFLYEANGGALQAQAGCRTSTVSITLNAAQQAEVEFGYEGSEIFFNPIEITTAKSFIDFTDDGGTVAAQLDRKFYKSPQDLAREVASKMTAASVGSGNDTITCVYDNTAGKYTIASDGSTLSLLWDTGTNTANNAGTKLGFDDSADDTGATTYLADNALDYSFPFTPTYDDATNIVVKNAELFVGDQSDNICRQASTVSFTIDRPTTDVDDLCAVSGVSEKLPESRSVTMEATLILQKHESGLFDKFINNSTTKIMMNIGPKTNGNFVAGKCINISMQNAKLTGHTVSGDSFVTIELTAKGFVSSAKKDLYLNYL